MSRVHHCSHIIHTYIFLFYWRCTRSRWRRLCFGVLVVAVVVIMCNCSNGYFTYTCTYIHTYIFLRVCMTRDIGGKYILARLVVVACFYFIFLMFYFIVGLLRSQQYLWKAFFPCLFLIFAFLMQFSCVKNCCSLYLMYSFLYYYCYFMFLFSLRINFWALQFICIKWRQQRQYLSF